jgi:outer membrane receptor for ferrienterochelin and colicins
MKYVISTSIVACILLAAPPELAAQVSGNDDDQAFAELLTLLKTKVTSATKTSGLTAAEAPGVVRVFTRQDIRQSGLRTLRELLNLVPGIQVQEYRAGHQVAWVRGVQSRYNNKVLWLLDGVPIRDGYYGHHSLDQMIPLDLVERIEVINGPGSVLYGTNAFAGVVSITTRKDGRSVFARYGTYETASGGVAFGGPHFYVHGEHFDSAGFDPQLNEDGQPWARPQDRRRSMAYAKAFTNDLEATFGFLHNEYADTYRRSGRDRVHTRNPWFGSAAYHRNITAATRIEARGYYEYYNYDKRESRFRTPGDLTLTEEEITDTSLYGVDVDLSTTKGSHLLVFGASHQTDEDKDFRVVRTFPTQASARNLAVPSVRRHDLGLFVQDLWTLRPQLSLIAGIRYDALSDFDDEISYRAGLTAKRGSFYGKILLGTAYRVPSYREYLDRVSFNFALKPEHMRTIEAQAGRTFSRGDVNLTLYNNRYRDFIKELLVATIGTGDATRVLADEYSLNADNRRVTGLELHSSIYPTRRLLIRIGASHILNAEETLGEIDPALKVDSPFVTGPTDVTFLSRTAGNLVATYTRERVTIGLSAIAASRRDVPAGYQSAVPAAVRRLENADAYFRSDVFVSARLRGKLFGSFKVTNVLDSLTYSPPIDNPANYDIEWPGRTFEIGAEYRF